MQTHFSLPEKKIYLKFAWSVSFMQNEWPVQINDQAIIKHFAVLACIHNLIYQSVLNKANAPTLFLL